MDDAPGGPPVQFAVDLMRMKIVSPGGLPQKVSLVPLAKVLDWTVSEVQLVLVILVKWTEGASL